jgi:hypothetical protein
MIEKLRPLVDPNTVVHYEVLSSSPVTEAKRLAKFLGMKLTDAQLTSAVNASSFDAYDLLCVLE